jgi:WD40 repeat protein
MFRHSHLARAFLALSLFLAPLARGQAPSPSVQAMRMFRDECLACHKPGKAKGGLVLNTREKMLKGGDNGASVTPGKGSESLLWKVLAKEGDPHMPPKKQLSAETQSAIRAWIDSGAAWEPKVFDELPNTKPIALGQMPSSYQPVLALALSPDEKHLAVARANELDVYDLSKPERPLDQKLTGHTEAIQSVAWSADGKWLASGGFRSLKVWDATEWREVKSLSSSLVGNITALAMANDNATLFASDGEPGVSGFIHKIAFLEGKIINSWKAHDDSIYALRLTPDGKGLASGSADKLARLWNTPDGKLITTYEGHTNHILGIAFSADASQLATAGADKELKIWDTKSAGQDIVLGDKKIVFTAVHWTADGKALVCVTDKGSGNIHTELVKHTGGERSEASKERKLENIGEMIYCVTATKDGQQIFAGAHNGYVFIWDSKGKAVGKIIGGL